MTFVWSLLYAVLGLAWSLGAPSYPFGPDYDPDAPLSALAGLSVATGGPVIAGLGSIGAVVALAIAGARGDGRRRVVIHVAGWTLAALLLLVVPDYRVLVAVAYAPIFIIGAPFGWPPVSFREAVPWPVVHQLLCIAGGLLWVAALVAYERRRADAWWDRTKTGAGWTAPGAATRWGRAAVAVAVLIPCLYAVTRWAWALGIPLGVSEEFLRSGQADGAWWAGAALATLAVGGAILTLGLIQRWGEVFPRWLPRLAGRRVPPALAIVPAALVALAVTEAGLMFVRLALSGFWAGEWENWGAIVPELLWPVWGVALGLATLAYYFRRCDRCAGWVATTWAESHEAMPSSPSRPSGRNGAQIAKRVILVALAALLGVMVGIGALLGVAAMTDRVPLFLLAGFVAFGAVFGLTLVLITRGISDARRRGRRLVVFGAVTILVVAMFAVTALVPLDDPRLPPAAVAGQGYRDLPTGSRISYVQVPAEGPVQPTPVVFLHGGPGVPDLAGDSAYFGRLARDGFDVYVYDQIGRGWSSRLDDPQSYTLERDVADLEAIRRQIGAERMVLIGHSNGGTIAAAYAAALPHHVSKLVLISPGDPDPAVGGAGMLSRLSFDQQLRIYSLLFQPRALLGYLLLQVNPRAAHAFAGDAEMDARFDRVYNRTRPALHCAGKPPGPELHGLGFYAHYYPQSVVRRPHAEFLPALAELELPTLIVKGRCDYLSWSSAVAYVEALPASRLVYFPDAGHNVYQDEPERCLTLLRAFLLDESLPEPVHEGHRMPNGYEGPA